MPKILHDVTGIEPGFSFWAHNGNKFLHFFVSSFYLMYFVFISYAYLYNVLHFILNQSIYHRSRKSATALLLTKLMTEDQDSWESIARLGGGWRERKVGEHKPDIGEELKLLVRSDDGRVRSVGRRPVDLVPADLE